MSYDHRDEFFDAGVGGDWSQHEAFDDDDGTFEDEPRASRSHLGTFVISGVTLLGVAVLVGIVHAQESDRRTPEAAVSAYVDLVSAGDAEAASALVPIRADRSADELPALQEQRGTRDELTGRSAEEVDQQEMIRVLDPAMVTNAAYSVADRISNVTIESNESATSVPVGATTTVTVDYELGGTTASSALRVERLSDSFPFLPRWRVIDSLAVPTIIRVTDPLMGTPTLGDVAIAGSGNVNAGFPQYATMVYPGQYVLDFDGGYWFTAPSTQLRVASSQHDTSTDDTTPVIASMFVQPSGAALDTLLGSAREFLNQCATRGPKVDLADCPATFQQEPPAAEDQLPEIQLLDPSDAMAVVTGTQQDPRPGINGTVNAAIVGAQEGTTSGSFTLAVFVAIDAESSTVDVFALPDD